MIDSLLQGKRPADGFDQLAVLGGHCSDREQRAEAAERELIKVKLLSFLAEHIGDQVEAVITGVEEFGLFAQGIELPAEGLIRVDALSDDYYRYDKQTHTLTGHREGNTYRLGDVVLVEIARVDIGRRELDMRLVRRLAKASGKRSLTAKQSGKKKSAPKRKTAPKKKAPAKTKAAPKKRTATKEKAAGKKTPPKKTTRRRKKAT